MFWSVTPQSAGAAVSGRDFGRQGVARRLDYSHGCAVQVPVAPAVSAVLAYLWCLDGTGCGVVRVWCLGWMHVLHLLGGCFSGLVPRCQPSLVGWHFLCVCAFGGFLL